MSDDEAPPRHALTVTGWGDVRVGKLYLYREIARRTSLTNAQASEAVAAAYTIFWEELLRGHRIRLGRAGYVSLIVRRGSATLEDDEPGVYPQLVLMGKLSTIAKWAWRKMHYKKWRRQMEEDGETVIPNRLLAPQSQQ